MPAKREIMSENSAIADTGLRARARRRSLGKTLQQVADASEISKGHLSRFERGEKVLSVAALLRLADALETSVASLTGGEVQRDDYHVSRANKRERIAHDDYSYEILSGQSGGDNHSTILLQMDQDQQHTSQAQHAGRELLYVVSGSAVLRIGDFEVMLQTGDYVEFPGHTTHEICSLDTACQILLTVVREPG